MRSVLIILITQFACSAFSSSVDFKTTAEIQNLVSWGIDQLPSAHQKFLKRLGVYKITRTDFDKNSIDQDRCLTGKYQLTGAGDVSYQTIELFVSKTCTSLQANADLLTELTKISYALQIEGMGATKKYAYLSKLLTQDHITNMIKVGINIEQDLSYIIADYLTIQELHPELLNLPVKNLTAQIKLLYSPQEAWFYRYKMIKEAKSSIKVQSYIFYDDIFGQALVALLIDALNRGVEVKMSVDAKGSYKTKDGRLLKLLALHGADVRATNPFFQQLFNVFKLFRLGLAKTVISNNHDKLLIVDDNKLITGGRNLGAKYFTVNGESPITSFQDLDVYAESQEKNSEAIMAFNMEYSLSKPLKDFKSSKKLEDTKTVVYNSLRTLESYMQNSPDVLSILPEHKVLSLDSLRQIKSLKFTKSDLFYPIQGIDKTSSHQPVNNITERILNEIKNAKTDIYMVNPYVIITEKMEEALATALQNNSSLQIHIITTSPQTTDSVVTQAYFIKNYESIQRKFPRIKFYGYVGPYNLHAKYFVIDGQVSYIGSYNLDYLSEQINSEFKLRIQSKDVSQELKNFSRHDLIQQSVLYDLKKGITPHSFPKNLLNKFKRFEFLTGPLKGIL